jgi:hypothetical protein
LRERRHAERAVAHARRGIRSGSKLIESLDMAQGALELPATARNAEAASACAGVQRDALLPHREGLLRHGGGSQGGGSQKHRQLVDEQHRLPLPVL